MFMRSFGPSRRSCRVRECVGEPSSTAIRVVRAVGFPGPLVAAVAERERVTVLHYDAGYDLIVHVTGQPMQWIVTRGTVP
jgi:hypothetical protein